jgi:hypothetical protein
MAASVSVLCFETKLNQMAAIPFTWKFSKWWKLILRFFLLLYFVTDLVDDFGQMLLFLFLVYVHVYVYIANLLTFRWRIALYAFLLDKITLGSLFGFCFE